MTVSRDGFTRDIAVPSRMYPAPTAAQPLAGKRISIKDCMRLAGVKTTQMNRAWCQLYGPEEKSAEYVTRLLDLGAVVVGKTKMDHGIWNMFLE